MALTTEQKLEQAEFALHQLLTGTKQVTVRYDETSVTYNQASIEQLRLYIAELKGQLGIANTTKRGGPFGVTW